MPDIQASADLMSPLNLFLQADMVVKIVMVGLLLAYGPLGLLVLWETGARVWSLDR